MSIKNVMPSIFHALHPEKNKMLLLLFIFCFIYLKGVPALVFLIIMSTTGLAGAAAITATLALLGPGGMIGGVITLTVIGAGASVISKYGYSAIITATCKKIMQKDNLTQEQMCEKIDKYPITKGLKEKVKTKIREA